MLGDIGKFMIQDSAPWWATVGLPVVTVWLGQRWSRQSAMEQREADAVQHAADLTAEAERLAQARQLEQGAAREQRIFDHKRVAHAEFPV